MTILQHIEDSHADGVAAASNLQAIWKSLKGLNPVLQEAVAERFDLQIEDAQFFSKVLLNYFHSFHGRAQSTQGPGGYNLPAASADSAPIKAASIKTDDSTATQLQVEEDLEVVIQEALRLYHKIGKMDIMGGEAGVRKRMLSYGDGLAVDDLQRVSRAQVSHPHLILIVLTDLILT